MNVAFLIWKAFVNPMKKVRKVVIPAAGPRIELSSREVYVLDSKWHLCGADPAYSVIEFGESIDGKSS